MDDFIVNLIKVGGIGLILIFIALSNQTPTIEKLLALLKFYLIATLAISVIATLAQKLRS
jgi:hypothetical protein